MRPLQPANEDHTVTRDGNDRMNSERLHERAPGILVEQDSCFSWPEPGLFRRPYGRRQDGAR
jgi:hypothetical protein